MRRTLAAWLACAGLASTAIQPPVPAKEFVLPLRDGTQLKLSSLKGKVVILEFLLTSCAACQNTGRLLERLQMEYGPRGFQALGCAVDANAATGLPAYRRASGATFPIGIRKEDDFRGFVELSTFDRALFPQIVVIDRAGVIRFYHGGPGDTSFLPREESILRRELDQLLSEKTPAKPPAPKGSKKAK